MKAVFDSTPKTLAEVFPLSAPQQIEEALDVLLGKLNQIADPFEQSFFALVHLPYLQPFAGVNKRTSRLVANLPLFRENLCPLTFLDVPEQAYSRAILGMYEMTRVELLRDLYVWDYERSTQEYLAIKQDLAEPDPLRFAWRDVIKQTIRDVVLQPDQDALSVIRQAVMARVQEADRDNVEALIVEELPTDCSPRSENYWPGKSTLNEGKDMVSGTRVAGRPR